MSIFAHGRAAQVLRRHGTLGGLTIPAISRQFLKTFTGQNSSFRLRGIPTALPALLDRSPTSKIAQHRFFSELAGDAQSQAIIRLRGKLVARAPDGQQHLGQDSLEVCNQHRPLATGLRPAGGAARP